MPRKRFTMAPDAARRRVECGHYDFNGGAPRCAALTHPWCLAPGEAPETCKFKIPKETEPPKKRRRAAGTPKDADHGEAD
ncbi:MAG: hypothetical protein IKG25_10780 [Mogibacterium sp.]|nr:hypothetical protein [Mogibacterium sp.]